VRKRIKRGTISTERDPDGAVRVLLDGDGTRTDDRHDDRPDGDGTRADEQAALLAAKDQTIDLLREQLEAAHTANAENRRLLAAALERIPELESPERSSEVPQKTAEEPEGSRERPFTEEEAQEAAQPRSWWRRVFGFE
jgi:hypothetical protein